ncbi:hypothetical protein BKI52_37755 [marine bacterium AO1-C]|nr:hypothetical protein BKI52_37755 [marine bacterium AO1-C]
MSYKKFSVLLGFAVWLLATLIFRFLGQHFFFTENPLIMTGLYIIVIPLLGFIANKAFQKYQLTQPQSIEASVYLVLPGMLLDVVCIQFFAQVFPNLSPKADASFGAWLMWAYASVLVFGLLRKKPQYPA